MERPNAWKSYDAASLAELEKLCGDYRAFISENKTERECVRASVALAEAAGYVNLDEAVASGRKLAAGDKVYAVSHNKTFLYHLPHDTADVTRPFCIPIKNHSALFRNTRILSGA